MGDVQRIVIDQLVGLLGYPKNDKSLPFYFQVLEGYSDDALEAGMRKLIAENETNYWPVPGRIKKFCDAALPPPKPVDNFPRYGPFKPKTEYDKKAVQAIVDKTIAGIKENSREFKKSDPAHEVFAKTSRPEMRRMMATSRNSRETYLTEDGKQKFDANVEKWLELTPEERQERLREKLK